MKEQKQLRLLYQRIKHSLTWILVSIFMLIIDSNDIEFEGIKEIATALTATPSLTELDIGTAAW